jgi:hypothetical protein
MGRNTFQVVTRSIVPGSMHDRDCTLIWLNCFVVPWYCAVLHDTRDVEVVQLVKLRGSDCRLRGRTVEYDVCEGNPEGAKNDLICKLSQTN